MLHTLTRLMKQIFEDKRGAVTVDFVVMTASVIVIFLLTITPVYEQSSAFVAQISDRLIEHASHTWE